MARTGIAMKHLGFILVILMLGATMLNWAYAQPSRRGANLHVDQGHPMHLIVRIGDTVSLLHDLTPEECERARQEIEKHVDGSKAWCWR